VIESHIVRFGQDEAFITPAMKGASNETRQNAPNCTAFEKPRHSVDATP
jgi:hypothetical protein